MGIFGKNKNNVEIVYVSMLTQTGHTHNNCTTDTAKAHEQGHGLDTGISYDSTTTE